MQSYAQLCLSHCEKIKSKFKIDAKEWTVLAGIVLTRDIPPSTVGTASGKTPTTHSPSNRPTSPQHEVLVLTTGTRCLGAEALCPLGTAVSDCHAEILARRTLIRLFMDDLKELYAGRSTTFFEWADSNVASSSPSSAPSLPSSSTHPIPLAKLKPGLSFHLYISQPPCGDASIQASNETCIIKRKGDGGADVCINNASRNSAPPFSNSAAIATSPGNTEALCETHEGVILPQVRYRHDQESDDCSDANQVRGAGGSHGRCNHAMNTSDEKSVENQGDGNSDVDSKRRRVVNGPSSLSSSLPPTELPKYLRTGAKAVTTHTPARSTMSDTTDDNPPIPTTASSASISSSSISVAPSSSSSIPTTTHQPLISLPPTNRGEYVGVFRCVDEEEDGTQLGILRTKSGRRDLPLSRRTLSMSCSDKLAKWRITGIQGGLLRHLLVDPIYISSVTIGAPPPYASLSALARALHTRLIPTTSNSSLSSSAVPSSSSPLVLPSSTPGYHWMDCDRIVIPSSSSQETSTVYEKLRLIVDERYPYSNSKNILYDTLNAKVQGKHDEQKASTSTSPSSASSSPPSRNPATTTFSSGLSNIWVCKPVLVKIKRQALQKTNTNNKPIPGSYSNTDNNSNNRDEDQRRMNNNSNIDNMRDSTNDSDLGARETIKNETVAVSSEEMLTSQGNSNNHANNSPTTDNLSSTPVPSTSSPPTPSISSPSNPAFRPLKVCPTFTYQSEAVNVEVISGAHGMKNGTRQPKGVVGGIVADIITKLINNNDRINASTDTIAGAVDTINNHPILARLYDANVAIVSRSSDIRSLLCHVDTDSHQGAYDEVLAALTDRQGSLSSVCRLALSICFIDTCMTYVNRVYGSSLSDTNDTSVPPRPIDSDTHRHSLSITYRSLKSQGPSLLLPHLLPSSNSLFDQLNISVGSTLSTTPSSPTGLSASTFQGASNETSPVHFPPPLDGWIPKPNILKDFIIPLNLALGLPK